MASSENASSLYPKVIESNPEATAFSSATSSSSLYPKVDVDDMAENLFPEEPNPAATAAESSEEVLIAIPGAIVHLIEKDGSVELAAGDLTVVGLRQGENVVAVMVRVGGDAIQWPLAKDEAAVKLDDSHYFFALQVPSETEADRLETLNYGLTIASKGQESLISELDRILEKYSFFSAEKVEQSEGVLDGTAAREASPEEVVGSELVRVESAAYWTTVAPNVEDYSGAAAKMIAAGSGQLIRGILWCGDVTVDRLKWGDEFFRKMIGKGYDKEISPSTLRRVQRVKRMTKRSEKVALGILSGVVKVSGFFTSPIVNSKAGRKFFSLLPGEIVLASLDGFSKVCDAVEVAGRNVMSTSSVVTTGLVSHRYGEQAGHVTNEGLDAAGHAIGTAWAVFKIRKALNPKSSIKPTSLIKAAAKANSPSSKSKSK